MKGFGWTVSDSLPLSRLVMINKKNNFCFSRVFFLILNHLCMSNMEILCPELGQLLTITGLSATETPMTYARTWSQEKSRPEEGDFYQANIVQQRFFHG